MKMYTKENLAFLLVKPVMGPFEPQISYETRRRLAPERKRCFSSSSEDGSRKR